MSEAKPRRDRRGMRSKHIPISTDCSDAEIDELLELWRDLAQRPWRKRARAALGRLLTTRAEDL